MIQAKVRSAGLLDIIGTAGEKNVQGEVQQKLDVYANQALLHCLGLRDTVAILVSEENEEPVTFDRAPETGKYVVFFDPLDGSSNIDVNVSVGTIFSVFRTSQGERCLCGVLAARLKASSGWLRGLRFLNHARVHNWQRRVWFYSGSQASGRMS